MTARFGDELRRYLTLRHISLRELARRSHYDPGGLSRVLNGRQPVSAAMGRRLDEVLDAGGELAALASPPAELDAEIDLRIAAMTRQRLVADGETVNALLAALASQRRLEDSLGSESVLPLVTPHLAVVTQLVADARGPARSRVVDAAAQWSQFAGWLHANIGDHEVAIRWYDRAAEHASETGDDDMTATALSMKGHIAWMRGQLGPMLGLSQAAQRPPRASHGVRAIAVQQQARAHAILGEANDTGRLLDEAETLAFRAADAPEDQPPWMYFFSPAFLAMQRGMAYRYLGRHHPSRNRDAADILAEGIACLPAEIGASEWAAWYQAELALAYIALREPEQACAAARAAVTVCATTGATRLTRQMRRLHAHLVERWPAVSEVVDLGELVATLG